MEENNNDLNKCLKLLAEEKENIGEAITHNLLNYHQGVADGIIKTLLKFDIVSLKWAIQETQDINCMYRTKLYELKNKK